MDATVAQKSKSLRAAAPSFLFAGCIGLVWEEGGVRRVARVRFEWWRQHGVGGVRRARQSASEHAGGGGVRRAERAGQGDGGVGGGGRGARPVAGRRAAELHVAVIGVMEHAAEAAAAAATG